MPQNQRQQPKKFITTGTDSPLFLILNLFYACSVKTLQTRRLSNHPHMGFSLHPLIMAAVNASRCFERESDETTMFAVIALATYTPLVKWQKCLEADVGVEFDAQARIVRLNALRRLRCTLVQQLAIWSTLRPWVQREGVTQPASAGCRAAVCAVRRLAAGIHGAHVCHEFRDDACAAVCSTVTTDSSSAIGAEAAVVELGGYHRVDSAESRLDIQRAKRNCRSTLKRVRGDT